MVLRRLELGLGGGSLLNRRSSINRLIGKFDRLMNVYDLGAKVEMLRATRVELDRLYAKEEVY